MKRRLLNGLLIMVSFVLMVNGTISKADEVYSDVFEQEIVPADYIDEETGLFIEEDASVPEMESIPEMIESDLQDTTDGKHEIEAVPMNMYYARVLADSSVIYTASIGQDISGVAYAGDVVLITELNGERVKVAFCVNEWINEGYMMLSDIVALNDNEVLEYQNEASTGKVVLYMDDMNWPLKVDGGWNYNALMAEATISRNWRLNDFSTSNLQSLCSQLNYVSDSTYWTNTTIRGYNSVTDTENNTYYIATDSEHKQERFSPYHYKYVNKWGGVWEECYGFAFYVGYILTGSAPDSDWVNIDNYQQLSSYGGLHVGDIIRSNGHSAIVYAIDTSGEITFLQAGGRVNNKITIGKWNGSTYNGSVSLNTLSNILPTSRAWNSDEFVTHNPNNNGNSIEYETDNLCFKDVVYPQTFKIDTTNGWNLSGGTLASNYDLKSIKSMIVDANGKTISSGTQSISGKFFSIRSLDTFSSSDNGVKFSYINAEGNYKWILIATDSNDRTLRLVMPFTAVSSGSTSTANMGKEYEDYYTVKSENVTYKVIKDVTARKTPFDNATKGSKYTKGKKVVSVAIVQNKYNNLWIKTNDNQYIYSGYHVEENDTVTVTGNQYFEVDNGGSSSSFAAALASLFILDVNAETINKPQDDTTHGGGGRTIEDSGSQQSEQWTYQVVTSDGLNMRSTPGTGGTIVATLWNPTTVAVSKKQSANNYTWGYGASSDGHTGWIVVDNNWTKLVSSETSAATHTHTPVTDAGYAATCTAEGKTEGSHCSVCGEVLTAQQTIPATGHTPVTDAGYAATCTAEGKTDGSHCSVCGEVLMVQETIPATGHTPTVVAGFAPTCTDVGYTDGSICAVCGEVLQACQPIPATGHSPVYVPAQIPAYQVPGYTEGSYCGVCGTVLQECVPIPALTYQELALPNVKSNGTVTISLGEQRLLVPTFASANGLTVTGFTSKKPAVASVDANGLLTANAEGKSKITVTTAEKKKATLTVQVVDPYKPTGIAIAEGKEVTVAVGQPLQLTAVLAPTTARATLTWTSSKPGVASVDANGLVTPLGEGKAKITVQTHNRKKAKITVKVVDPYKPDGIAIAQGKAVTLRVGEVLQLNAGLSPATAQSALTWTSKKPAVATVDQNGVVTALKKGKAKITVATYNRKKTTITVYVVD